MPPIVMSKFCRLPRSAGRVQHPSVLGSRLPGESDDWTPTPDTPPNVMGARNLHEGVLAARQRDPEGAGGWAPRQGELSEKRHPFLGIQRDAGAMRQTRSRLLDALEAQEGIDKMEQACYTVS